MQKLGPDVSVVKSNFILFIFNSNQANMCNCVYILVPRVYKFFQHKVEKLEGKVMRAGKYIFSEH